MDRPGFGTDGVRGVANLELTPELALALGRAAARVLQPEGLVVGRDTRESGPMLQAALSAGMAAEGVDVVDVGVLPTAAVAYSGAARAWLSAMVSASHNPFSDNGIKLFDPDGIKLHQHAEAEVEAELDRVMAGGRGTSRGRKLAGERRVVGWLSNDPAARDGYLQHLLGALGGRRLDGLSVVADCANGAASAVAFDALAGAGADVEVLCADPDGTNINDGCGSTSPGRLAAAVPDRGADLGLAFDGDADRLVAVDHSGAVLDGDALLAVFACDLAARGELAGRAVAVTVMTNLGFRREMARRGIAVVETPVGDRHVLEAMDATGLALGGEQSGHIVFRRLATTGDGILTGLLLADTVVRSGRSLAEVATGLVQRVPQVLVNLAVSEPQRLSEAAEVWEAVAEAEEQLGATGRVLLRRSGTEPLVRVMVEATSAETASETAERLAKVVAGALGGAR